jgi:2'-5' RNA ligase
MPGIRLFTALALLPDGAERLHGWAAGALGGLRGVRVVPAANLHVTLVFCGHHPREAADQVAGAADEAFAGEPDYAFACGGVRSFGTAIAVLLEPLGGAGPAAAQARLEQRLVAAGLARDEGRPWTPHVTVARVGRGASRPRLGGVAEPGGGVGTSGAAAYTTEPASGGVSYRRVGGPVVDRKASTAQTAPRGGER